MVKKLIFFFFCWFFLSSCMSSFPFTCNTYKDFTNWLELSHTVSNCTFEEYFQYLNNNRLRNEHVNIFRRLMILNLYINYFTKELNHSFIEQELVKIRKITVNKYNLRLCCNKYNNTPKTHYYHLPKDLIHKINQLLTVDELCNLSKTDKFMYVTSKDKFSLQHIVIMPKYKIKNVI